MTPWPHPTEDGRLTSRRGITALRITPFTGFRRCAYTSLLEELDPVSHINLYDVFVLSAPVLWPHVYGISPPEELLKRMFDPVATTDDPKAGGLGISPAELMRTAKHTSFSEAQAPNGFVCSFG